MLVFVVLWSFKVVDSCVLLCIVCLRFLWLVGDVLGCLFIIGLGCCCFGGLFIGCDCAGLVFVLFCVFGMMVFVYGVFGICYCGFVFGCWVV